MVRPRMATAFTLSRLRGNSRAPNGGQHLSEVIPARDGCEAVGIGSAQLILSKPSPASTRVGSCGAKRTPLEVNPMGPASVQRQGDMFTQIGTGVGSPPV